MTTTNLCSDHVNYLIWRYLQEASPRFRKTAVQLQRDWNRSPEHFSFASEVKPGALIHLLLDALAFNDIKVESQLEDAPPYAAFARKPVEYTPPAQNGLGIGASISRTGTPQKRHREDAENVDTSKQAGKRSRRNAVQAGSAQSDSMDVDTNGVLPDDEDGTATNGARSPTVDEPPLPPPTTLANGQSVEVQTEAIPTLTFKTHYLESEKQESSILHTAWVASAENEPSLFTAGDDLCRVWDVPDSAGESNGAQSPHHMDLGKALPPFSVSAIASNRSKRRLTMALLSYAKHDSSKILTLDDDQLSSLDDVAFAGDATTVVSKLSWNSREDLLLALRVGEAHGSLRIWHKEQSSMPIVEELSKTVTDACWINDTVVALCGSGFVQLYDLQSNQTNGIHSDAEAHKPQMTIRAVSPTPTGVTYQSWHSLRFYPEASLLFLADNGQICALRTQQAYPYCTNVLGIEMVEKSSILQIELQPQRPNVSSPGLSVKRPPRSLLAVRTDVGTIIIYSLHVPSDGEEKVKVLQFKDRLEMRDSPFLSSTSSVTAMAMAWSPDGEYLAAGGYDQVCIWAFPSHGSANLVAVWKGEHEKFSPMQQARVNGDAAMDVDGLENEEKDQTLSWDTDSRRVAFGVNKTVAIITLEQ